MKKCFTINPFRTTDDFLSYEKLLDNNLYQAIEIFFPYNIDSENQVTYFDNVKRMKKNYPHLEVVMHLPYGKDNNLCDIDNYSLVAHRMKKGMDFASYFQTEKLTLHLGQVKKDIERTKYLHHIVAVLRELCDYASQYKMQLMIENMPGDSELGYSPEEIKTIIETVDRDNLKFILDTGHAHVSAYNSEDYIEVLKNYLYHIHFSDNNGQNDEHKRMGLGTINFESIFKKLKDVNYSNLHCMEVIFNSSEDLELFANDLSKYDIYY